MKPIEFRGKRRPHVLANHAQRQTKGLRPFSGPERQQAVSVTARAGRRGCSVEIYRGPSSTSFLPGGHDILHLVARLGADLAHDLFEHLHPVP
ncbi:hypothetical protein RF55_26037 [Lasius niger]|uniref:Uncharacterized protein n=1 Tax=Lasius niger TaxID=67767 RepID=A0A0J7JTB2_LASNI|nr:hypothetical protein RF55_26037 [Lasius niger]